MGTFFAQARLIGQSLESDVRTSAGGAEDEADVRTSAGGAEDESDVRTSAGGAEDEADVRAGGRELRSAAARHLSRGAQRHLAVPLPGVGSRRANHDALSGASEPRAAGAAPLGLHTDM
eukprot:3647677-Pyramimonas_sp.AAC.1